MRVPALRGFWDMLCKIHLTGTVGGPLLTVWWSLSEMSPSHCISRYYQDPTDLKKELQL